MHIPALLPAPAGMAGLALQAFEWQMLPHLIWHVLSNFWPVAVLGVLINGVYFWRHPSGLRRLVERYPAVPPLHQHHRFFADVLVVGELMYRNAAWLTIDAGHLHVSVLFRKFSVPLADIVATAGTFRWGLWTPGVFRLSFGREPTGSIRVLPKLFAKLLQASGGRLRAATAGEPSAAPAGAGAGNARA